MDIVRGAANIIKLIYAKRRGEDVKAELVKQVCIFFDARKKDDLTEADLRFLRYIASEAGVPQYYEMLNNFKQGILESVEDIHLDDMPVIIEESNLYTSEKTQLHKYQKKILDKFKTDIDNRYFLSASTSFGKTFLIYEIIRKMRYHNICLIFPTIALLSENILKIFTNIDYAWIKDNYRIHTLSEPELDDHNNLFIYTPERFLSFLDKHGDIPLDFFFVDEVYKIDNEFLVDDEQRENERDVAYRIATHVGLKNTTDCLLAGPYININPLDQDSSVVRFLNWAHIELIDFNDLEIVSKEEYSLGARKSIRVKDIEQPITFTSTSRKRDRLKDLVKSLVSNGDNVIIYCATRSMVETYTAELLTNDGLDDISTDSFTDFINHLERLFNNGEGANWIVTKALKKGIGVHHGFVPKYIQNEIISLFNANILKVLVVTTTITEGVNTTAKNMIVLSHMKGRTKELKTFDAKNIEGRAGRFIHHFVGRVFIMDQEFKKIIERGDELLRHKFFDRDIEKSPVDYPYVEEDFLTDDEKERQRWLDDLINRQAIPEIIVNSYKTVSPEDKCHLYESIKCMEEIEKTKISRLISQFVGKGVIYKPGFDVICDKIKSIAPPNGDIVNLIELRRDSSEYCTLTNLVAVYMSKGFIGEVNYYTGTKNEHVNLAVQKSAKFIFNTLRYQVVKYVGLFNLCYKTSIGIETNVAVDKVTGLDKLLMRMEYNAATLMGRKASDAGASFKVVDYYDKLANGIDTENDLDNFEKNNAKKIKDIVNS